MSELAIDFSGDWFRPPRDGSAFEIGRDGDLAIADNPYLHRRFLRITFEGGIWWLANVGSLISVTVADAGGGVQSWLSPGNRIPIVFPMTQVMFTAGPTAYELHFHISGGPYQQVQAEEAEIGSTTIGMIGFTLSQRQLMVALAEHVLQRKGSGLSQIPSSAQAAVRLGWTLSQFNRKLDNVCDKLDRIGLKGMRGGPQGPAMNRRTRLVEYAVSSRVITVDDLPLLDQVFDDDQ